MSDARLAEFGDRTPYPGAPELCVEVMSPVNTWSETHVKAGLYLPPGAQEVCIVGLDGQWRVITG